MKHLTNDNYVLNDMTLKGRLSLPKVCGGYLCKHKSRHDLQINWTKKRPNSLSNRRATEIYQQN